MTQPFVLPETAAVLEFLAAQNAPHLSTLPAADMRAVYSQLGEAFDMPPDTDVRTADFTAGGLPMRAYHPGPARAGPVIVYYHGGGWVIGDLDTHDPLCRMLAKETGLRVVAVDYRLAPEAIFPAAHEDCLAAVGHVLAGLPELGAPVEGIAVAGDSAGGNLALYVAGEKGAAGLLGQFLIYPAGDCTSPDHGSYREFAEGYLLDRLLMDRFIGDYLPDEAKRADGRVSPLLGRFPQDVPPAVILTAGLDPLRDQGRDIAGRIAAQGQEVHYIEAEGLIHGMATMRKAFPTGDSIIRRAARIFAEMITAGRAKQQERTT